MGLVDASLPLGLGDFGFAEPVAVGYVHSVRRFIILAVRLVVQRSHHESAGLDVDEPHAEGVGEFVAVRESGFLIGLGRGVAPLLGRRLGLGAGIGRARG